MDLVKANPRIDHAARELLAVARAEYAAADRVLERRPKGRLIAPRLMSAVYGRTLDRTAALGWSPPRTRVKLGKGEFLWLVLRRGLLG